MSIFQIAYAEMQLLTTDLGVKIFHDIKLHMKEMELGMSPRHMLSMLMEVSCHKEQ